MATAAESDGLIEHNRDLGQRLKSILQRIVERKDTVDGQDTEGQAALHLVAQHRGQDRDLNVSDVETFNQAYQLPLNSASALAIARLFLANGAEVDIKDRKGRTPLHIAVDHDNLKMVALLLNYGADAGAPDNDHMTPLHLSKQAQIAKLLLANGALIISQDKDGYTPLHLASGSVSNEVVQVLLKHGADVNARDNSGGTALHLAVYSGSTEKTRDTIRLLLKSRVNVNAENNEGYTAIQEAIRTLEVENILALLEQNVEAFPQAAKHGTCQVVADNAHVENSILIGRLIDASIKLKTAGLSPTRDDLIALANNPGKDYFDTINHAENWTTSIYGHERGRLKLECEAELEKLKNRMVTDTMSLYYVMFTNSIPFVFSKALLDALQMINYATYPIYEKFMMNKFNKLKSIVSAKEHFNALLRSGRTKVQSLPEELVFKVLVHLDSADMKKLISCSNSL